MLTIEVAVPLSPTAPAPTNDGVKVIRSVGAGPTKSIALNVIENCSSAAPVILTCAASALVFASTSGFVPCETSPNSRSLGAVIDIALTTLAVTVTASLSVLDYANKFPTPITKSATVRVINFFIFLFFIVFENTFLLRSEGNIHPSLPRLQVRVF